LLREQHLELRRVLVDQRVEFGSTERITHLWPGGYQTIANDFSPSLPSYCRT
jgi:hypothetical protein